MNRLNIYTKHYYLQISTFNEPPELTITAYHVLTENVYNFHESINFKRNESQYSTDILNFNKRPLNNVLTDLIKSKFITIVNNRAFITNNLILRVI